MSDVTELELAIEKMNEAIRMRRKAIRRRVKGFEIYREIYENPPHKLIARSIKRMFSKDDR